MNCRQASDKLPLFVGGDLAPAIAAEVEEHLSGCAACREERAAYEDARGSLFSLKGAVGGPTPDLWPSIRKKISGPPRRFPVTLRRLVAVAASLLALLVGARFLFIDGETPVITPGIEAPTEVVVAAPTPRETDQGEGEFLLEEVQVTVDTAGYRAVPSLTTLDPERSGWDEF